MIRKLILYSEGIETLAFFSKQIGRAFEAMGYETFYFDLGKEYDSFLRLLEFIEPGRTASVAFNFNGCSGEPCFYDKNEEHLFDYRQVPTVNIVVDHPLYYHKFVPYLPKDYRQLSIDGEHEDYLRRFFPDIQRGPFMPLAGTAAAANDMEESHSDSFRIRAQRSSSCRRAANYMGWDERPIEVVFTGHYNPPEKQEPVFRRNGPEYESFYHEITSDLIDHPWQEMTGTIEKHLRDTFPDITEDELRDTFPYMLMIDLYIRHYFRGEVVRTLVDGGVPVHVFGTGWELLSVKHPENLITHPGVDSMTCLMRIRESKISLNVMPWFKRGAHDRVFNSMLNGAVCVTDPSRYLEREFPDGDGIFYYRLEELKVLPDMVKDLLSHRKRWEQAQQRAYERCAAAHTWAHRAQWLDREVLRNL